MKILILYAAYGGGHISAAKAIKEYIEENYPEHSVSFVDSIKYINKTFDKISTGAYVKMSKSVPKLWGATYEHADDGTLGKISTSTLKLMSVKLLHLINEEQPDLIISTHPFTNQMCGRLKRKEKINCIIASCLTDFASHAQWLIEHEYVDYFFVAHNGMKDELILSGVNEDKIYTTGIPISTKFSKEYNKSELLKEFGLREGKITFLFFAGGEHGMGRNTSLFAELMESTLDFQMIAVAGRNEESQELFNTIVEINNRQDDVKVLGFTDKVPELMHMADFVITKPGGITTSEALACNIPIIVVNPVPGQEDLNANFILNQGLGIRIYQGENAVSTISMLVNNPTRIKQIKEMTSQIGKPNATKDICEILL